MPLCIPVRCFFEQSLGETAIKVAAQTPEVTVPDSCLATARPLCAGVVRSAAALRRSLLE